jgi:hypothetical protein
MPRSIFAIRSWWRMIIAVMAIAPPTRIALIGTSKPPKLKIESINRFTPPPCNRQDFLVELTGIEPVASWLQTRRSPS